MVNCRLRQSPIRKRKPHMLFEPTEFDIKNHSLGLVLLITERVSKVSKRQQLSEATIALSRRSLEEESQGTALRPLTRWYCLTAAGSSEFEMGSPVGLEPRSWSRRWPTNSDVYVGDRSLQVRGKLKTKFACCYGIIRLLSEWRALQGWLMGTARQEGASPFFLL